MNHPNIVHIYDIDSSGGTDYIAMELVDGKTLDQLIGKSGLVLRDTLKYAIQVADALARAHAAGIVHRGLKPANKPFTFRQKLKGPGTWRAQVKYVNVAPYKASTALSKSLHVTH